MAQKLVTRDALLRALGMSIGCFGVGAAVYLLTKVLKLRYQGWTFSDPRQVAIYAFVGVFLGWLLTSAYFFATFPPGQRPTPMQTHYSFRSVIRQTATCFLYIGPVLIVMLTRQESWVSVWVSRHNLLGSVVVGLFLALVTVTLVTFFASGGVGVLARGLNANHFWALLHYAVVGFSEEFVYRGYLQTRLVAWIGLWQGWALTSFLFAVSHIRSQRVTVEGMPLVEATINSASLIPVGLLFGYVMLRTENLIAPGLFHTFVDWVRTLQSMPCKK